MEKIQVNGNTILIRPTKSTFHRTADNMKKEIFRNFSKIGITPEFIQMNLPRNQLKIGEPAQINWTVNGHDYFYECRTQERYIDNLGVISKLVAQESYSIRNGLKKFGQVMNQFSLGFDGKDAEVFNPWEIIGITPGTNDIDYLTYKYKQKAKEVHPDTSDKDKDLFQNLQQAYQILKKEMEQKNG